jgi:hypothetical protein
MPRPRNTALEDRTARLTLLIDPRKKQVFENLCASEDLTPSQVVRRLIRDYIEAHLGQAWHATQDGAVARPSAIAPKRSAGRRS